MRGCITFCLLVKTHGNKLEYSIGTRVIYKRAECQTASTLYLGKLCVYLDVGSK
jgi:hypothetical protein